jgi:hypothetical protein
MANSLDRLKNALRDLFFGVAYLEFEQAARQEKLARLDLLLLFSEMFWGFPFFPPIIPYGFCPISSPLWIPGKREY